MMLNSHCPCTKTPTLPGEEQQRTMEFVTNRVLGFNLTCVVIWVYLEKTLIIDQFDYSS